MGRCPSAPRWLSVSSTPRSLSKTTSPAAATPGRASPIVTIGISSAIAAQPPLAGPTGTTTSPSTRRSTSRRGGGGRAAGGAGGAELAAGRAVGVRDQRAAVDRVELALDGADQLLVPEVGEAADEQPDDGRLAARQRPGDGIDLVAELVGGEANALLGFGRHVHAAERVAHRGGRQPRPLGELADRRALLASRRHAR